MDGPKNAFRLGPTFPPEIWASITIYLSGEQIGRLKMTGSKGLWRQLCAKHSVKSINLGTDFLVFKRWPAFVNELGSVEELVISHSIPSLWFQWQPKLRSVPGTLKKLRLCIEPSTDQFFFVEKSVPLSLREFVPNLELLDISLDWCTDYPWMANTPSTLKTLKINRWVAPMPLPPSITRLKAQKIELTTEVQLPSQLQSISVGSLTNLLLLSLVPPSFTKLKVKSIRAGKERPNLSILSKFPSGMEKILLLNLWAPPVLFQPMSIPNHLKMLVLLDLPVDFWSLLPLTLTTFRLLDLISLTATEPAILIHPLTKEESTFNTIPIHKLPASLTELELRFLSNATFPIAPSLAITDSQSSLFPASLVSLSLAGMFLTVEAAKLLPGSLRLLSLSRLDPLICEQLPRNLTRLVASDAIVIPELIKFLPRGLKYFWMSPVPQDNPWNDPYTAKIMKVHEATSLYFSESTGKIWQGDACLPPSLTELSLNQLGKLSDEFIYQKLPILTTLDLPLEHNFTDLSMSCLSRVLCCLELPKCANISGKCFSVLPQTLTRLNLNGSRDIEDSDIQHLPSVLKVLIIDRATHLTDDCVHFLPRQLEVISLRENETITLRVLDLLPPCIRSLQIACSIATLSWSIRKGVIFAGSGVVLPSQVNLERLVSLK